MLAYPAIGDASAAGAIPQKTRCIILVTAVPAPEATATAYRRDLTGFALWFADHVGAACMLPTITPPMCGIIGRISATGSTGRRADNPVATVKDVREEPRRPRWIPKRDLDRLLRELEAAAKPSTTVRDRALVLTLRHTGLRVGELVSEEGGERCCCCGDGTGDPRPSRIPCESLRGQVIRGAAAHGSSRCPSADAH
jgi:hypothetical protein